MSKNIPKGSIISVSLRRFLSFSTSASHSLFHAPTVLSPPLLFFLTPRYQTLKQSIQRILRKNNFICIHVYNVCICTHTHTHTITHTHTHMHKHTCTHARSHNTHPLASPPPSSHIYTPVPSHVGGISRGVVEILRDDHKVFDGVRGLRASP
jgi:hypothetical protein